MADFKLIVGADVKASYSQFKADIQNIVASLNNDPPKIKVALDYDKSELNELRKKIENASSSGKSNSGGKSTAKDANAAAQAYKAATKAVNEYYAARMKLTKGDTDIDASSNIFSSKSGKWNERANQLNQLKKSYEECTSAEKQNLMTTQQQIELRSLCIKKEQELSVALERSNNLTIRKNKAEKDYATAIKQAEKALDGSTKAAHSNNQEAREAYENLQHAADAARKTWDGYHAGTASVGELESANESLNNTLKSSKQTFDKTGTAAKTLTDRMGGLASKFASWLTISQVVMALYNAIRRMVSAVIDVDTAMTELKKVTDETNATYERFLSNATSRAKALGATVADTVNATADFARLGYDIDEASSLADAAIVYKNVGDGIDDISTASESIISTMKAFGIEAEDAMTIVDKFNEVGNNFAISSVGVGEALLRSASAMHAAGNTLDETIGLVTAANSVVQAPDKVGTALKTVSMYLRAAKTEAEDAGESTEGMASSVSELRDELMALTNNRVDIQIDEDTFKSTYQILEELSKVWDDLTDITQANILELIGGKRNSNVVSALIENFDIAQDVVETSLNSAGSAMAENEKYMESINGHIAQFKATFEQLSTTLIGSDFVSTIVDIGTGLLNILNVLAKIIDAVGGLNTVLGVTAGIFVAVKAGSIVKGIQNLLKPLQSVINGLKTARENGKSMGQAIRAAFQQATAGAGAFQTALGWVGVAISAISIGVGIFKKLHKSNEELIQDADDLKSAYSTASEEISSNLSTLSGLEDEYTRLSAGVDDYGNNVSLAADDYDRYKEIVSTIVGISPELISGYDAEGNAIANKNGLLEKSIALMKEEQRVKMKELVSDDNLTTLFKGEAARLEEALNNIELPNSLAYSGVKILEDGELEYGYVNQIHEYIEKAIGVAFNNEGIDNYIQSHAAAVSKNIGAILNNASKDFTDENGNTWKALSQSQIADLEEYILSITGSVDSASASLNESLQLIPQTMASYDDFSDLEKDFLTRYVNSFDITTDTTESDILQIKNDIIDFTNSLASDEDLSSTIKVGISLSAGQDEDGNALTVSEYQKEVQNFLNQINSFDEETQLIIRTVFGIEEDSDSMNGEVDKAIEHVKNLLEDKYDSVVDDMTTEKVIEIYYNISAEPNSLSLEELEQEIQNVKSNNAINDFTSTKEDVTSFINDIKEVQNILNSQTPGQSISLESYDSEALDDYRDALEYVNGSMQLNADKVREIAEAKAEEQIAVNDTNKAYAQAEYLKNANQIDAYRRKLRDKNFEEGETAESVQNSIDALRTENEELADICQQYDLLSANLREATGAYQHWLNAQSAADYGDMADESVNAIERIRDTLINYDSDIFGEVGSLKYDAAVDLIIPDSVDKDDASAVESYMRDFSRYLMFDDSGNAIQLDTDQFLADSVEAGLMNYDGLAWTIAGEQSAEDFAKGLNMSVGMVEAFFDRLELLGGEFDFSDELGQSYGDIAMRATEAAEAIKSIEGNDDMKIVLNVTEWESQEAAVKELENTIQEMSDYRATLSVDSSEYKDATTVLQYAIMQRQILTQPAVMTVDTSQVTGEVGEALSLLQEYQSLKDTIELKAALGLDTSEAEAELATVITEISNSEAVANIAAEIGVTVDAENVASSIDSILAGLDANAIVTLGVDASLVAAYEDAEHTTKGSCLWENITTEVDLYAATEKEAVGVVVWGNNTVNVRSQFDATGIIRLTPVFTTGVGELNGTAHVSGTARVGGNWGTAPGGRTLVGD